MNDKNEPKKAALPFPSILYLDAGDIGEEIPPEVITDVRLDALLSENVTEIIRRPCSAADIAARREIVKALDGDEFMSAVRTLESSLVAIQRSSEFLSTARSDNERYVYFASYARDSATFMKTAASLCTGGVLMSRMSEYFARISAGERFGTLQKKLDAAALALKTVADVRVRVNENSSELREYADAMYGDASYFDIIANAAEKLGLDLGVNAARQPAKFPVAFTEALARMYYHEFSALRLLYTDFRGLLTDDILVYRAELGFYLGIHELCGRIKNAGIPLTYPKISQAKPMMTGADFYDISLLAREEKHIIPNDIDLSGDDAFCFLVGANGGGKTTYIRTVGISLLLFLCGSPIPARSAEIYPFKHVYTHFPADERFEDTGRLLDEVNRMKPVIDNAGADTLALLNETYSGTDERRANELTRETTEKLRAAGTFGVYVTHFHDVADMGVTMLAAVIDTSDENRRLYKIVRQKAVKSSYASDILKMYRLDGAGLKMRAAEESNKESVL